MSATAIKTNRPHVVSCFLEQCLCLHSESPVNVIAQEAPEILGTSCKGFTTWAAQRFRLDLARILVGSGPNSEIRKASHLYVFSDPKPRDEHASLSLPMSTN